MYAAVQWGPSDRCGESMQVRVSPLGR
uniref:Uncharacterized protein n=1 Tax=Arundo donax TaxID=35708 RepID=A0A0A9C5R3_ARUDO